jgi:hypothetical protein
VSRACASCPYGAGKCLGMPGDDCSADHLRVVSAAPDKSIQTTVSSGSQRDSGIVITYVASWFFQCHIRCVSDSFPSRRFRNSHTVHVWIVTCQLILEIVRVDGLGDYSFPTSLPGKSTQKHGLTQSIIGARCRLDEIESTELAPGIWFQQKALWEENMAKSWKGGAEIFQ